MTDEPRERPFVLRWRSAVLNSSLSATQKLCLLVLAEWADANGENCYPSIPSIALKASVNEKTVRRSLDQCADLGFFTRTHRGTSQGWRRFEYTLTLPQGADTESTPQPERADTVPTPKGATCGHSVPDVRTLSPERVGTESTDLALYLSRDLSKEEQPPPKGNAKKAKSLGQTYRQWVDSKPEGENLIPGSDPIFDYAEEIGLPREILHLHWMVFSDRHEGSAKRQKDWKQHFRNSVRGNWFKLWYLADDGSFQLTTPGKQADREFQTGITSNHDPNRLHPLRA